MNNNIDSAAHTPQPRQHPVQPNQAIITKVKQGKIGRLLWAGDTSHYENDKSVADFALCVRLLDLTKGDRATVSSLFRQSGLNRDKCDEPRGASTYLEYTIRNAEELRFGRGSTHQYKQQTSVRGRPIGERTRMVIELIQQAEDMPKPRAVAMALGIPREAAKDGVKKAAKLISKYGSAEAVLAAHPAHAAQAAQATPQEPVESPAAPGSSTTASAEPAILEFTEFAEIVETSLRQTDPGYSDKLVQKNIRKVFPYLVSVANMTGYSFGADLVAEACRMVGRCYVYDRENKTLPQTTRKNTFRRLVKYAVDMLKGTDPGNVCGRFLGEVRRYYRDARFRARTERRELPKFLLYSRPILTLIKALDDLVRNERGDRSNQELASDISSFFKGLRRNSLDRRPLKFEAVREQLNDFLRRSRPTQKVSASAPLSPVQSATTAQYCAA